MSKKKAIKKMVALLKHEKRHFGNEVAVACVQECIDIVQVEFKEEEK